MNCKEADINLCIACRSNVTCYIDQYIAYVKVFKIKNKTKNKTKDKDDIIKGINNLSRYGDVMLPYYLVALKQLYPELQGYIEKIMVLI